MSKRKKKHNVNEHQKANKLQIIAKTPNQKLYLQALKEYDQVFAFGPAGTGKTYIPTMLAAQKFLRGEIKKIILTRPAVPACGEDYGYLPGSIHNKIAPWVVPVMSLLEECIGKQQVFDALKSGAIEVVPFGFMRGRTFSEAYIIVDEAQNTTPEQMEMLVTRIGEGSKLVVSGDLRQSDLGKNFKSGLKEAIYLAEKYNIPAGIVQFTSEDVVRCGLCKLWVMAYEKG